MTKLTEFETKVLSYLAQGYSQAEAARKMGITPQNLNMAVNHIRRKRKGLERAVKWYQEQNQDAWSARDELPEEDEPKGEVSRCGKCGLAEPHMCIEGNDHLYRDHENDGISLVPLGGGGHSDYIGGRFKLSEEPLLTSSHGRGRK